MALPKLAENFSLSRRHVIGGITAAGIALGGTFGAANDATAQDVTLAAQSFPVVTTHDEELEALGAAMHDAGQYASECFQQGEKCVGILLHIGDDMYAYRDSLVAQSNQPAERIEELMLQRLQDTYSELFEPHGIEVQIFPRANPGTPGTGLAFHIDNIMFENSEGRADLNLAEAQAEIPNVVLALDTLRRMQLIDLSQAAATAPGLANDG